MLNMVSKKNKLINISQAKSSLSALIERASKGEVIVIGRAGRPVAKIVQFLSNSRPRKPGALKGKIQIAPDFDTLPDDIAEAFGIPTK